MVLEMIQTLLKNVIGYAALVFKVFAGLLPAQIDKRLFTALHLTPIFSSRQYSSYKVTIVTSANIKADILVSTIADLASRDGGWAFIGVLRLVRLVLGNKMATLRIWNFIYWDLIRSKLINAELYYLGFVSVRRDFDDRRKR